VRLYYFVTARHAVEDIAKQRLKVSRFFDLNDPFELFAGEQSDRSFRKKMKDWAEKLNEQEGVLCFTKGWRDPLMWSHYGDRHRGMCLGFDVCDLIVKPIDYRPERLSFDEWKGLNAADPPRGLVERLLTTKFARWEYENERRVIVHLAGLVPEKEGGDCFFRRFDGDLRLVEVFAGPRCCVKWKPHIKRAIEQLPAKPSVIKTRLSFKQFKVVTQKVENSVQRGFESDIYWRECGCRSPRPHDIVE